MKKFIFRRPFVTKNQMKEGLWLLDMTDKWVNLAVKEHAENGITDRYVRLMQHAVTAWNESARKFGFRNLADMNEYISIHGKL